MLDPEFVHEALCGLPGVAEHLHNNMPAYKYKGKILATFNIEKNWLTFRISLDDQAYHSEIDPAVYPVPNKWGTYGWTHLNLEIASQKKFLEIISLAKELIDSEKIKVNSKK